MVGPQRDTDILRGLAQQLFSTDHWQVLQGMCAAHPISYPQILDFDKRLGGPSILGVACNGHGRYHVEDRAIFRPLQYVSVHFHPAYKKQDLEWQTRDVVEMSSLHIESLVKRIGKVGPLPLGQALRDTVVKAKLDPATWQQLTKYTRVYNDAKHKFDQSKDTHLFSAEDALLAYFISRQLGRKLYPLADLKTDLEVFDAECDDSRLDSLSNPNRFQS